MNVDYDELVKNYCDGLFNKLRNFTPGPEFLDMWVHDEDHARSIFGVFEAAGTSGLKSLSVSVGPETAKTMDLKLLQKDLCQLGKVTLETKDSVLQIAMRFQND